MALCLVILIIAATQGIVRKTLIKREYSCTAVDSSLLTLTSSTTVIAETLYRNQTNVEKREEADFTVVVLTMNRVHSLKRLLNSIEASNYENDFINLVIQIDWPGGKPIFISEAMNDTNAAKVCDIDQDVLSLSQSFEFTHGRKSIIVNNGENLGLKESWFRA